MSSDTQTVLEIKMVVNLEHKGKKSEATLRIFSSSKALAFGRGTRHFYVGRLSSIPRGFSEMSLSGVPSSPTYCNILGFDPGAPPDVSSLGICQICQKNLADAPLFVSPPSRNDNATRLLGVRVMEKYRISGASLCALVSFYGCVLVRPNKDHPGRGLDVFYDVEATGETIPNGDGPWFYEPFEFVVLEPPRVTDKSS